MRLEGTTRPTRSAARPPGTASANRADHRITYSVLAVCEGEATAGRWEGCVRPMVPRWQVMEAARCRHRGGWVAVATKGVGCRAQTPLERGPHARDETMMLAESREESSQDIAVVALECKAACAGACCRNREAGRIRSLNCFTVQLRQLRHTAHLLSHSILS
ncbi:hypothetical protein FA95DRAFT_1306656 [Auriscalpium vulgare]|uniref:Uncharacterized protein n=1 Tax=Auriscalpium vulgare TaxID=40419 RepID=A0ACB8R3A3_9AGAM|nr:hypothetical protein FA95DRAFT_1306656 [Auriscalpium vulgare]